MINKSNPEFPISILSSRRASDIKLGSSRPQLVARQLANHSVAHEPISCARVSRCVIGAAFCMMCCDWHAPDDKRKRGKPKCRKRRVFCCAVLRFCS